MIILNQENCIGCGLCEQACMFGAVRIEDGFPVISDLCTGCGICVSACPAEALGTGEERQSDTDRSAYQGIWVVNVDSGRIVNSSLELLSKAAELSEKKGAEVTLLSFGRPSEADEARIEKTGCEKVLFFGIGGRKNDPDYMVGAIAQAVRRFKPEIMLFGATADGRDIAPKVACRLKTGLTADCTGLDIDENGDLLQVRPTYGGNIMATIRTPDHRPQMATVRPGVFEIIEKEKGKVICEEFPVSEEETFGRIRHVSRRENSECFADVEEAEIILAGGYGLGSRENFQKLYILADKLGAAVAATRKAVDEGWAPMEIQVGQTGKTVRPAVYIAFGISGALQHMLGMKNAKRIIAVNNDPAAPIFGICDKAIFGDAGEIVQKMLENL